MNWCETQDMQQTNAPIKYMQNMNFFLELTVIPIGCVVVIMQTKVLETALAAHGFA